MKAGLGASVLAIALAGCAPATVEPGQRPVAEPNQGDWPVYGGNAGGDRYSELTQIDRSNVSGLEQAWRFNAGEGGLQTSPLVIDGRLYAVTADKKVLALDGSTGGLLWQYDSGNSDWQPARGLSYWSDGSSGRLFVGIGSDLLSLDAATGELIESFGAKGRVDLRQGLGRDPQTLATFMTTPGAIFRDLIITGFRTSETAPAAPGAVRAYDVRTGALRWTFDIIPKPGQPGHETWPAEAWKTAGGANAWAGMVVDEKRGIVFAPTGSPVNDFYGADRLGANSFANALLAIDANTGKLLWHFQGVHHDLLDRDFPSPPVLLTVVHEGKRVDAVAQASKQGMLFVFERTTGKPLFPIEERPVPQSDVPGERSWPTQPFALKPLPFARQSLTSEQLTQRSPEANAWARQTFATLRQGGPFMPLAVGQPTLVLPGFDGGAEWGGQAVDRRTGVIYVNSNDVAWYGALAPGDPEANASRGARAYQAQCAACHGAGRQGSPPDFPALTDIGSRMMDFEISAVIERGRGRMPAFPQVSATDRLAIVAYLLGGSAEAEGRREVETGAAGTPARYAFTGYKKFLDPDGYPAVAPPWGTLNAIDLNTGDYLWKIPLGEYPELVAQDMRDTGSENYGGPIVTAGGVLFIGATIYDRKFRAFDTRTGRLLWQAALPYAGTATPITYMAGGRQYVVIATSGARDPKGPKGSAYVAFALP